MSDQELSTVGIASSHTHFDDIKSETEQLAKKVLNSSTIKKPDEIEVKHVHIHENKIEFEVKHAYTDN